MQLPIQMRVQVKSQVFVQKTLTIQNVLGIIMERKIQIKENFQVIYLVMNHMLIQHNKVFFIMLQTVLEIQLKIVMVTMMTIQQQIVQFLKIKVNQHVLQILTQGSQACLLEALKEQSNLKHLILKTQILFVRKTLKIRYVLLNNQEEMPLFKAKHLAILQKVIAHQEK